MEIEVKKRVDGMTKRCVAIFVVLLIFLNGCSNYNIHLEKSKYTESAFEVQDCAAPLTDGKSTVLENDNQIEEYRTRYGLGTCHSFEGKQTVVLFFMDDDESAWNKDEVIEFTEKRVFPALSFLQEQAERWGVNLSFEVKRYSSALSEGLDMIYRGTVIKDLSISGSTKDLPEQAAAILGFDSGLELLTALMEEYGTDKLIPLMLIDKNGTSYARTQLSEQIVDHMEHAVLFTDPLGYEAGNWLWSGSATIAHEILHLFGAEDYYKPYDRLVLAEKYYINDIMLLDSYRLSRLDIGTYTGYCIGWTDQIPEICYNEKWYSE